VGGVVTGAGAGVLVVVLVGGTAAAAQGAVRAGARARATGRAVAARAGALPGTGVRPWLLAPPGLVERRLLAADLGADGALLWTAFVVAVAVGVPVALVAAGPGLAVVVAVGLVVGPAVALALSGDRRDRRLEAALPDALEAVARALRSGASLRLALAEAAPAVPGALGHDLRDVSGTTEAGVPLLAALARWEEERPLPGVRLAVAALGLGAETGGAQARSLDGVAETLRGRLAVTAEVRALSSQARLSGLVIALSPIVFSGLATATDARTADFLFRTPAGVACLLLGLGLDAVAAAWMTRLCRVEP
jgi:tight adherence protein B